MKKFRTVVSVIIMVIAAIVGFFVGAALHDAFGGAIVFAMIAEVALIVYNLDNREK